MRKRKLFTTARLVVLTAVLVLCLASMALGALAFSTERVTEVKVEVPVGVPVEQKVIVLEDIGISLILPDSWKDRYVVIPSQSGGCHVYVKMIYGWCVEPGQPAFVLFPETGMGVSNPRRVQCLQFIHDPYPLSTPFPRRDNIWN